MCAIKKKDLSAGGAEKVNLKVGEQVQAMVWNYEGSALATAGKDKMLRVFDPRSADGKPVSVSPTLTPARTQALITAASVRLH